MPEGDSRRERTSFSSSEIRWLILLIACGELVGIVAAVWTRKADPDLSQMFATAAITLLFGSLLGGVVTLLIAEFDRRRVQRAAELDFIGNVLADLKAVHDQVDRGRMLIKAHQSAKTYGEEMRGFMEARVRLQSVERALRFDERGRQILTVRDKVESMESYLRWLLEEFEENYKTISLEQRIFEAKVDRALKPPPGAEPTSDVRALPPNLPWKRLEGLDRLKDFLRQPLPASESGGEENTTKYRRSFLDPLDQASEKLRDAFADRLSAKPPVTSA